MQNICILTPLFNDWDNLEILTKKISNLFSKPLYNIFYLVVNDFSNTKPQLVFIKNKQIKILNLNRNVGHQRAISIGLSWLYENKKYDKILVMDVDGEDKPEDISVLLELSNKFKDTIIFAERKKRSETHIFKLFYKFYKFMFFLLTKEKISFGNFSLIPNTKLETVVNLSDIWVHYSAGILKSKLKLKKVKLDRGKRYKGESKMNFTNLVIHGLSSISIFLDVILSRIILFSFFSILFFMLTFIFLIILKYYYFITPPGWLSLILFSSTLTIIQIFVLCLIISFQVLNNKIYNFNFPLQNYKNYLIKNT